MLENALDYEGLKYYDGKSKDYVEEKITALDSKKIDKTAVATSSTLGLVKSGTDITVDTNGNVSVKDNSHKHTVSNISDLTATVDELNVLDGITATTEELNYVDGVTSNIQTQLNKKAALASPTLTGTPKAPTAASGTNTTQIATTAFVQTAIANGIAASDAMIIKGTIGASGTVTALPTTYKTGWTYRVVTAGTYAGQICEIGDLIVALVDRSGSGNVDSDWCVAQTNINGAITGIKSGDAYITTSQSGSVVTITHKDVTRTNTTSTVSPSHGGTFTAVKTVTSDEKGHVTGVDTETVTLPKAYTHPSYTAKSSGLYKIAVDSTGHVSEATAVTKSDITALGIPGSDTNTHYTSKNVVGSSTATSNTTSTLTNGNVYLNSVENGAVTSAHKISGSGATTVTTDTSGNIVISSTDTNTDTKVTSVGKHYAPSADSNATLSADASSTTAATWNSTSLVTGVNLQRDAKGHVTGVTVDSIKMPANPNSDTNTAHSHSAGVGLVGSGNAGTSGTYTYKAKLRSETALTVDSAAATTTSGKVYPVAVDKSGYLAVNVPWTDTNTDTHYTTGLKVGASATATANATATNGNVYLNVLDNTTVRDSHKIVGSGSVSVTSDANGVITINGTDNNTTYTHPTYTARTGKPTANQTPAFGGTATISQITSDGTGHVTGMTDRTITIPSTLSNGSGTVGLIKTTSTVTSNSGYTACPVINGVPYYKDSNTDTKVTQTLKEDNANYPLLLAPSGQTATKTTTACFNSGVTLNPSTNTIEANINGNATKIESALETTTYLAGNQGRALVNSNASAGTYTALSKLNSLNGYFCDVVFGKNRLLTYTSKETVDAGTNAATYKATLLTEEGNTLLPGLLTTYGGIKTTTVNDYTLGDACAKGILNNTTKGALGYTASTAQNLVPTVSTIAWWDGAYRDGHSNLAYCAKGAFGDAVTKGVTTEVAKGNEDLVTSGAVYSAIKERNFILIGDSYLMGYNPDVEGTIIDSWGVHLSQMLPQYTFNIQYISGSGFGNTNENKNFLGALKAYSGDKNVITDILVCGGYNDVKSSMTSTMISTGMSNFMTYAKENFPNAKVHIGFCGACSIGTAIQNFKDTIIMYQACGFCGAGYISNMEYSIKHTRFLSSDKVHPNKIGQKNIAWNLASYLISGNTSVIQQRMNCDIVSPSTVTTNMTLYTSLNNETASLYHPANETITFTGLSSMTLNSKTAWRINLGTLTNSCIIGNQSDSTVSASVTNAMITVPVLVLLDGASKFLNGFGIIEVMNLEVYLRLGVLGEDGKYTSGIVSSVIVPPFTLNVDSLDV